MCIRDSVRTDRPSLGKHSRNQGRQHLIAEETSRMSQRALAALKKWRGFASTLTITVGGERKTWEEYTKGNGYVDEERIVQPTAFPAFAAQCLDWTLQVNLAPEESGTEGKPDFTPADSVTHPFVFETKSTRKGVELVGDEEQVRRYLTDGAPRIKTVLLT